MHTETPILKLIRQIDDTVSLIPTNYEKREAFIAATKIVKENISHLSRDIFGFHAANIEKILEQHIPLPSEEMPWTLEVAKIWQAPE